jgi:hypothetical protein
MTLVGGLITKTSWTREKADDILTVVAVIFLPAGMLIASLTAAIQSPVFAEVMQDMGENLPSLILP